MSRVEWRHAPPGTVIATPPVPETDEAAALGEKVAALLDEYNQNDDGEVWECAPEDRWRFGRDLSALLAGYRKQADR